MSKATVVISDISGTLVPDGQAVTVIVRSHPTIQQQVQIDAGAAEVKPLLDNAGEYVVLDITVDGETTQVVVDMHEFHALFKGDAYTVLANATPVKTPKVTGTRGNNSAELAKIREWAAAQGIEVSAKGRIKQEVVDAYHASQAA